MSVSIPVWWFPLLVLGTVDCGGGMFSSELCHGRWMSNLVMNTYMNTNNFPIHTILLTNFDLFFI